MVESTGTAPRGTLGRFLLRGGLLAALGRFGTVTVALAVHSLVAFLLPPEDVGRYFLLSSVVLVARTLGRLGIGRTVVRELGSGEVSEDPGRARRIIASAFGLAGGGGLLVAALMAAGPGELLLAALGSELPRPALLLAGLWTLGLVVEGIVAEVFRGLHRIGRAACFNGLVSSLLLALLLLTWSFASGHGGPPGLSEVVGMAAIGALLSASTGLVLLIRSMPARSGAPGPGWAALLAPSLPILASTLIAMLIDAVGLWILGAIGRPQAELALFGIAQRMARLVGAPVLVANAVLLPVVARLHSAGDRPTLTAVLRLSATVTGALALAATAALASAGPTVLDLVFGAFYRQASGLLLLLALGQLVLAWSGSCGVLLLMTGHQNAHLKVNLLTVGILVAGGILLAGPLGALGMALATLAATVFQQLAALLAARRRSGIWTAGMLSPRRVRASWRWLVEHEEGLERGR